MRSRTIAEAHGLRTLVAVLDIRDEVSACLQALAMPERFSAAQVSAIGAFRNAALTS
jgi:predicted DNA-binding protein with PD1-like motif